MESRRRLPHIWVPEKWTFVTWHLHGSLPPASYPPPHAASAGHAFVWIDRYLDAGRTGPLYLKDPRMAGIVADSLRYGERIGHYELRAFVIMANHVHAVLLPRVPLSRLMKSIKGVTAREANRILGRTGEVFWQAESYDHFIRDEDELKRI